MNCCISAQARGQVDTFSVRFEVKWRSCCWVQKRGAVEKTIYVNIRTHVELGFRVNDAAATVGLKSGETDNGTAL